MAKKPADAEVRPFEVTSPLLFDGEAYDVGDKVELTFEQFTELKTAGVIAGEWPRKA